MTLIITATEIFASYWAMAAADVIVKTLLLVVKFGVFTAFPRPKPPESTAGRGWHDVFWPYKFIRYLGLSAQAL